MIQLLHRLRIARLVAVLAVLLTAGVGPHVHAVAGGEPIDVIVRADLPEDESGGNDVDSSPAAHCGFCHVVRAMLPDGAAHSAPMTTLRLPPSATGLPASRPAPDLPARPPRPSTA